MQEHAYEFIPTQLHTQCHARTHAHTKTHTFCTAQSSVLLQTRQTSVQHRTVDSEYCSHLSFHLDYTAKHTGAIRLHPLLVLVFWLSHSSCRKASAGDFRCSMWPSPLKAQLQNRAVASFPFIKKRRVVSHESARTVEIVNYQSQRWFRWG